MHNGRYPSAHTSARGRTRALGPLSIADSHSASESYSATAAASAGAIGDRHAASGVWATVAARRWWWPGVHFGSEAADAAVAAVGAAVSAAEAPAAQQPAAVQQLAARATVAAFIEGAGGGRFAARVAQLCRRAPGLGRIADEVIVKSTSVVWSSAWRCESSSKSRAAAVACCERCIFMRTHSRALPRVCRLF